MFSICINSEITCIYFKYRTNNYNEDEPNLGTKTVIKNEPARKRVNAQSSSTSPHPAPRRSLEEKEPFNQEQRNPSSKTSMASVSNIRKFAGIDDEEPDVLNRSSQVEVPAIVSRNAAGNKSSVKQYCKTDDNIDNIDKRTISLDLRRNGIPNNLATMPPYRSDFKTNTFLNVQSDLDKRENICESISVSESSQTIFKSDLLNG